ncbi:phospholipase D family protein [Brachybacterium massiliense]|uniref:phospholipase D family protein n=1 Tax=Brachybacterium massiliense TaxID=1755098 RepID=UPI000B3BC9E9|nr:phospholipase D-like domain-containing protein [Brachybacterium massiliense]
MLQPDTSVLLTDALRPPPGHEVDVAVTTTYSLNLTAMLIAPMTFAFAQMDDSSGVTDRDPAQLLEAVQRFMGRTTVFCQAAGIRVPASHSRIHTFLEGSLHEVEPPADGALFHPKLWAIRYRRPHDGALFHRAVVGSRNLTLDSSWDTALVLDESPDGTIDAAPAGAAVEAVTGMVLDPLTEARRDAILDLAGTLRDVRLEAPDPFTSGRLLPIGIEGAPSSWPFPDRARKVIAISPFLSTETLTRIRAGAPESTLLTRAAAADLLGGSALRDWDVNVLDAAVDGGGDDHPVVEDATGEAPEAAPSTLLDLTGLHAKTVVIDGDDGQSAVITGSANLTRQAWSKNVEFDAVLVGPTRLCGVDAVLGEGSKGMGLRTIMEPYSPASEAVDDPSLDTSYLLEEFHRQLARSTPRPRMDITRAGDDAVTARLTLVLPEDSPGETTLWPLTAPNLRKSLAAETSWELSLDEITPFIAVETTSGDGPARATRRCLLKVPLIGDVIDREQRALATMLNSRDRVLRYLALLLGLDEPTATHAQDAEHEGITSAIGAVAGDGPRRPSPPIVLFEPLVRAAGNDIDRILSVRKQVEAVLELPKADELIPPDFLKLWDTVLKFSLSRRTP